VIARLLAALDLPEVAVRAVVLRSGDTALKEEVERSGGMPICPDVDPPDMRSSVEAALQWIRDTQQPTNDDAWLLVPGDHPVLEQTVTAELIAAFRDRRARLVAPTYRGRRGHPLLARWDSAAEVIQLPRHVGLNHLVRQHADEIVDVPVNTPAILYDLDTPEDYERLAASFAPPK
jgi:molybdenum cofactor cytidylyltransferase